MRRIGLLIVLLAAAGCHKQEAPAPQAAAPAETAAPAEASALVRDDKGKAAPTTAIDDLATSKPVKLADLKGKPTLVNLWATWCVPCVKELPTLDRLAGSTPGLQVIAVSEDMDGAKVVTPFLQKTGVKALHAYHDRDNGLMLALKEGGLPVTILYGADGKEVWRMRGDLDWTGAKAKALLAEAGA